MTVTPRPNRRVYRPDPTPPPASKNRRRAPAGRGALPDPVVRWWHWMLAVLIVLALSVEVP